ncbi:hypothetical protein F5I97DRAFT_1827017 [Phlebopus sp. FC_14]|nr:hypothetical protein F5I97DRAFT_1827017 [Phlebopus sp. FC_14]
MYCVWSTILLAYAVYSSWAHPYAIHLDTGNSGYHHLHTSSTILLACAAYSAWAHHWLAHVRWAFVNLGWPYTMGISYYMRSHMTQVQMSRNKLTMTASFGIKIYAMKSVDRKTHQFHDSSHQYLNPHNLDKTS